MDRWVYETLKEEGDNFPQWHLEDTINDERMDASFAQSKHRHHQKKNKKQFIGGENIDEEVQEFVSNHTTGLSEGRHHGKHHKKPDIAERGMDE